ncbi:enoyl-CoA hydratase [Nakamurella antarctica]|uniref:Enoyl-CoA hydratase n=1 Tax=Nakamurella antarctica TaxID=1902245 RepID=A0A3G8ZKR8_9ACTN|nr:enoyl-CoA hydratase-related protein [Nakamurella antarctica]AZI57377.1 enoyl-CoA hydratase [Nakamurella antarctica]
MSGKSENFTLEGGVARIVLTETERGAPINPASLAALAHGIALARKADARIVVLSSAGKAFSVGGDIKSFASATDPEPQVRETAQILHNIILELHGLNAIVISVVQGVAAGAGFPLAAAADIVLAARSARFTFAYSKIGLTPDGGSTLLAATLGLHRTLQWALLNPLLTAQELCDAGLVAAVYPDDELEAGLASTIQTLLQGSRSAQVSAKRLIRNQAINNGRQALDAETAAIAAAAASLDGLEGVRAFVGKRPPNFLS